MEYYFEKPTLLTSVRKLADEEEGMRLPTVGIYDWSSIKVYEGGRYENVSKSMSYGNLVHHEEVHQFNRQHQEHLRAVNWTDYVDRCGEELKSRITILMIDKERIHLNTTVHAGLGNLMFATIDAPMFTKISGTIGYGLRGYITPPPQTNNSRYDSNYFKGL